MDFSQLINYFDPVQHPDWSDFLIQLSSALIAGIMLLLLGYFLEKKFGISKKLKIFLKHKNSMGALSKIAGENLEDDSINQSSTGSKGGQFSARNATNITQIGAVNGPITIRPDPTSPTIGFPEEILRQASEPRKTVILTRNATYICEEIEKYFPGKSGGIMEAYSTAQKAMNSNGEGGVAASKYLQIFKTIEFLFKNPPAGSDLKTELKESLFKFAEKIEIVRKSLNERGTCNQSEIDDCERRILSILGEFLV